MPRPVAIRRGRRMRGVSSHVAPRPTGMPVRVLVLVVAAVVACWLAYGQRNARLQADGLTLISTQPPQFQKARDLFVQANAFSFSRDNDLFVATTDWNLGHRAKEAPQATKLKAADLEIDLLTRTVTRAGKPILLQPREFKLLEYLVRNAGHIVTRTMLLENVWDYHFDPQTNVIDVHISRLRAKIDKGHDEPILQTVRGAGYMIRDK